MRSGVDVSGRRCATTVSHGLTHRQQSHRLRALATGTWEWGSRAGDRGVCLRGEQHRDDLQREQAPGKVMRHSSQAPLCYSAWLQCQGVGMAKIRIGTCFPLQAVGRGWGKGVENLLSVPEGLAWRGGPGGCATPGLSPAKGMLLSKGFHSAHFLQHVLHTDDQFSGNQNKMHLTLRRF